MAEQGEEVHERPPHGGALHWVDGPCHRCERASECPLIRKERMRPGKAPTSWARRGRICQDTERMRPSEGHLPLETMKGYVGTPEVFHLARGADELGPEEGGTCRGKGKGE